MGKVSEALNDDLVEWIGRQHVFFVATAPSEGGHVNLSPKGLDSFRVLDPATVAYLDLTGSGIETVAHLQHDGRITVMFCAFEGPPRILRLYGQGEALRPGEDGFDELAALFPTRPGVRSVIRIAVERVATSCGYGVPRLTYSDERPTLTEWAERKGPDGVTAYQRQHNRESIDGLPVG